MNIGNEIRSKYIKNLDIIVDKKYGKQIEQSIYDFTIDYAKVHDTPYLLEQIYESKVDEIINLLKDKENYLLKAIKEGVINVLNIGFMKPAELNPDKYNHIINKKKKKKIILIIKQLRLFILVKNVKKIDVKLHKDKLDLQMNLLQLL